MIEEKSRYEIKDVEEAMSLIDDSEIKEVLDRFVKDFSKQVHFQGVYNSKREIREELKERVLSELRDQHLDLKDKITHLRKSGKEVTTEDLKLMRFSSKLKILKADFCLKNYDVVKKIVDEVKVKLEGLEKENEPS